MLENGYVKPYEKLNCSKLPIYQAISLKAKRRKRGLFREVAAFQKCLPYVYPTKQKALANH